jgi:hypothetical protein
VPTGGLHRALMAAAARDPKLAAPAQYVDALLTSFAQGPSYQARQLFVPIALGMLAGVGQELTGAQQQQLWAALRQLAQDEVPSVRQALAAAVAPLQQQQQQQQYAPDAGAAPCEQEGSTGEGQAAVQPPAPAAAQQQQQPQQHEAEEGGTGPCDYRAPLATVSLVSKQHVDKGGPCSGLDAGGGVTAMAGTPAAPVEESVLKLRDCQQMRELLDLLA